MKTKKIMWVGRSALMLEGKMKEKTVPGAVDLRGKASIREKHLQKTYDEKEMIPRFWILLTQAFTQHTMMFCFTLPTKMELWIN